MTEQRAITRAERRDELAQTEFGHQGGQLMVPKNGRELMDMAEMMSRSDFMIRDFYRGNVGACAALIMITAPLGMNPFQVSWKTYKASKGQDAPISFEAQLINAMVNVSAPIRGKLRYKYSGEGDSLVCRVIGIDRETGAELDYESPPIGQIRVKNSRSGRTTPGSSLATTPRGRGAAGTSPSFFSASTRARRSMRPAARRRPRTSPRPRSTSA